jgi:hypothetical protein
MTERQLLCLLQDLPPRMDCLWLPPAMDRKGAALMESAGNAPCPMCASKPVIVGRAPKAAESQTAAQGIQP